MKGVGRYKGYESGDCCVEKTYGEGASEHCNKMADSEEEGAGVKSMNSTRQTVGGYGPGKTKKDTDRHAHTQR